MTPKLREQAAQLCSALAGFTFDLYWWEAVVALDLEQSGARELASDAWRAAAYEHYARSRGAQHEQWAIACSMLRTGWVPS